MSAQILPHPRRQSPVERIAALEAELHRMQRSLDDALAGLVAQTCRAERAEAGLAAALERRWHRDLGVGLAGLLVGLAAVALL